MTNIRGSELGGSGSPDTVQGNQTPADSFANPTDAQDTMAFVMVWNGTTWDRLKNAGAVGIAAVGGSVGSGVADAGNPVKVGGKYNSSLPTFTDGQRGDLQLGSRGGLLSVLLGGASPVGGANANTDGISTGSAANVGLYGINFATAFNGVSFDRVRTPTTFKTALATAAGDTAVWTPTSGKKFRLMAYAIYVTANASQSVAGTIEIVLRDATTALGVGYSAYVPGAAGTTFVDSSESGWIQLGNGPLSATANNVLNVNLSATFATGEVRVVACGTEE